MIVTTTATPNLKLRSGPSTSASVIAGLLPGTRLVVLDTTTKAQLGDSSIWSHVHVLGGHYDGAEGYVRADYLAWESDDEPVPTMTVAQHQAEMDALRNQMQAALDAKDAQIDQMQHALSDALGWSEAMRQKTLEVIDQVQAAATFLLAFTPNQNSGPEGPPSNPESPSTQ